MKLPPLRISLRKQEALTGYLFISPWIIGFLIFTIGPMIASLYYSFTDYDIISPPKWNNFANYKKIFEGILPAVLKHDASQLGDPLFWQSLKVTVSYAMMALPLGLVFGFLLAVLLNQKVPGVNVWRTIYFMPSVIAGVAVALLWGRIFNPRAGILNPIIEAIFHVKGPGWLSDPQWAIPALVIMGLWGVGGGMIVYLAGLQGVPTDLYDAAKVDGANLFQRFRHITLPMMTPVIFYNLVLGMIGTFQYFTEVYVLTANSLGGLGAPVRSTLFYNLYLYQSAFRYNQMGYAATMAWILFVIVLVLTLLVFRSSDYWVFYEGQLKGKD